MSYNTRELTLACIASLHDAGEIIVVDNNSQDGSAEAIAEQYAEVHLIRNERNLGFGAANNQGLDHATQPMVLYINSDARATPGALAELMAALNQPGIAAVGGGLEHPDGRPQPSAARALTLWAVFCEQWGLEPLGLAKPYWVRNRVRQRVNQVMGACLMTKSRKRFDEDFFLYCEDTELCKRISEEGEIWYVPEARFFHELGASSASTRARSISFYNRGKELYFRKHHGPFASFLCWKFNRQGAFLRLIGAGVLCIATINTVPRFRARAITFWKVLFAPIDPYRAARALNS